MKSNYTLHLWNIAAEPAKMVLHGEKLTIAGIECIHIGVTPNHCAYFWLGPGVARFMDNDELYKFGLAVISQMEGVKAYKRNRDAKPA